MEQFDTDEKLLKSQKEEKNKSTISCGQFILIAICSAIALCAFYCVFNQVKAPTNAKTHTFDINTKYPVLLADIGGTNVRLRLMKMSGDKDSQPEELDNTKLGTAEFPSIENLLEEYLDKIPKENYPVFAVFGIPGPVKNNEVLHFANIPHWPKFNGDELAKKFNIKEFVLLNDFTCNGYGVQTNLKLGEDYIIINDAKPQEDGPKLIVGPGTGLGMGYLVKDQESEFYSIGASEGGHQDYTAKTNDNFALREYFKKTLGNTELSIERILSGQGLIIIYKYLKSHGATEKRDKELEEKIEKFDDLPTSPAANEINIELVNKGLKGECELSKKVLEYFIGIFGDVAGDVSLFTVPTGGLYLVGGLSIVLEPLITGTNIFMEHYLKKDNFDYLLKSIPIYLVKNGDLGMLGAIECARRLLLE